MIQSCTLRGSNFEMVKAPKLHEGGPEKRQRLPFSRAQHRKNPAPVIRTLLVELNMLILLLGLLTFLGIHSVRIIAPEWRATEISARGLNTWKGLYSLGSLLSFVLLIWGYSLARPEAAFLFEPPTWMKHITLTLMLLAFISLSVSQFPAGRIKPLLRHPMLLAVKLWAFGHLLANGDAASLLLFLAFLAWAIIDRISVKRRELAGERVEIPVGPVSNDLIAVVLGVAAYWLFVWKLHEWLIGVPVI